GLAHAKANLKYGRRLAAEHLLEIEHGLAIGYAPDRQQFVMAAALGVGDAALAQDEAADVGVVLSRTGFRLAGRHLRGVAHRTVSSGSQTDWGFAPRSLVPSAHPRTLRHRRERRILLQAAGWQR